MTIQEIRQKCKAVLQNREFLTAAIIILIGTASFGLGRLSVYEERKVPITIEYPNEDGREEGSAASPSSAVKSAASKQTAAVGMAEPISGGYVASKNGTKYYLPWCGGVSRIKEENKVWFATKEEAEKAGYTPAANCKGI